MKIYIIKQPSKVWYNQKTIASYSPDESNKNGKDGINYLSDSMVSLSDILMDVCFGL